MLSQISPTELRLEFRSTRYSTIHHAKDILDFICYMFSEVTYPNSEYQNTSFNTSFVVCVLAVFSLTPFSMFFFITKAHVMLYSASLLSLEMKVTNWKVSGDK